MPSTRAIVLLFAVAVLTAGCGARAPYVYKEQEFNRERSDFAVEPKNISAVAICYNSQATTAATIRQMAAAECGRFDKTPRFKENEYLVCPFAVPVLARFDCVKH